MLIAVGSTNAPKLDAVKKAATKYFPKGHLIDVVGISISSGVSSHPTNPGEARQGAMTRALGVFEEVSDADYWVGIEGGLEQIQVLIPTTLDKRVYESNWVESGYCAILDRGWRFAYGQSGSVRILDSLIPGIMAGDDLNAVFEAQFDIPRIGDAGGYAAWLTGGALDRAESYVPGLISAFSQISRTDIF